MKHILPWVLIVAACGGGGGSSGGDVTDFGVKLREAVCALGMKCQQFPDEGSCEARLAGAEDYAGLAADVQAGVIKYDAGAVAACLAAVGKLTCDQSQPNESRDFGKDCGAVIQGTIADGAACVRSEECVSGSCNLASCTPATCCLGTCDPTRPPPSADGADCSQSYACQGDDRCYASAGGGLTCQPLVAKGGACTQQVCAEGTICMVDATTGAGTCQAPLPSGAACTGDGQCGGILACLSTTKTCGDRLAVGATCDPNVFECVGWAQCDYASATCMADQLPGVACTTGADCASVSGSTCDPSGWCVTSPMACSIAP
jgi:hypothetical protein